MEKAKTKKAEIEINETDIDWSKYPRIKHRVGHVEYYSHVPQGAIAPEKYMKYFTSVLEETMEKGVKTIIAKYGEDCKITVSGGLNCFYFSVICQETDAQLRDRVIAKLKADERMRAFRVLSAEKKMSNAEKKIAKELEDLKNLADKYNYEITPKSDGIYISGSTVAILSGEAHAD